MGYTEDDCMVRVDFFKESGKWYCTEAVRWFTYGAEKDKENIPIHQAFVEALGNHLGFDRPRLNGMQAVCLEPYHRLAHPLSLVVGGSLWCEYVERIKREVDNDR